MRSFVAVLAVAVLGVAVTYQPVWAQPTPDTPAPGPAAPGPATPGPTKPTPGPTTKPAPAPTTKPSAEPTKAVTKPTVDPRLRVKLKTKWALSYETWRLYGPLRDDRKILRAFFATKVLKKLQGGVSGVLGDTDRINIRKEAKTLGYHLVDIVPRRVGPSTEAMIKLMPITYVRRVEIDVDAGDVGLVAQVLDRVFSSAVRRRMRIRPGYKLKFRRYERDQEMIKERDRIEDYLREEEGYYDVVVKLKLKKDIKWAATLDVKVFLGSRYKVGNINVVGNLNIRLSKIRSMFYHKRACIPLVLVKPCLADQRFSKRQLKQDIEAVAKMYRRRGFPAVRVYHDYSVKSYNPTEKQVDFTVYINERRRIGATFNGNAAITSGELRKHLTFSKEGSYDPVEVTASAEAVRKHYQSKGYFETTVTTAREPFKDETYENIIFMVDEGPKLRIKAIKFKGNKRLSDAKLMSAVRTTLYSARTPFSKNVYPTSSQLASDAKRVRRLYVAAGFPDAKVTLQVTRDDDLQNSVAALAAMIAANQPTRGLIISYDVKEGAQRMIGGLRVEFVGTHSFSAARLRKVIDLKPGAPFLKRRIEKKVDRIKSFYFRAGFPNAKVVYKLAKNTDAHRPTIVFRVDETQRRLFGKLIIRGNFRTKAWVIRDELDFNGRLTSKKIDQGQRNLLRANLFNGVTVELRHQKDTTEPEINVLVHVQERHDRTLDAQFGAGFSTDSKEFIEGGLTAPNVRGWGVRGDAKLFFGAEFKSAELKLTLPRWIARRVLKTPVALAVAAFLRNELTERFGELLSFGSSAEFTWTSDRAAFKGWRVSLRYDIRQRNREEKLVRGAGPRDGEETDVVGTRTAGIGPRIVIERRQDRHGRENVMDPQKGYRVELRALFASSRIGGDDEFIKTGISAQYFSNLGTQRFTLMNGVRYDQGFPLGSAVLLPEVERYFAGGDTTIRGFEEDRLATEIVRDDVPPFTDLTSIRILPAGGNLRFLHNIDLQVKLFQLGPLPVASGIFVDTGLVANSLDTFKVKDLRHSVGTALRISSPFFRFSLEWAIPLDPELGDNPLGRFHFTIGALF